MQVNESADMVVVGAGIAGLVTAVRATQLGLKPLVIEKGESDRYLCNSRYTGGAFHVGMDDIKRSPDVIRRHIDAVTDGQARPELADALAHDAGRVIDWLRSIGARFVRVGPEGWAQWMLAPPGLRQTGLHWEGRGGDVLLRDLAGLLAKGGGRLMTGCRATSLIMDADRCAGVVAVHANRSFDIRAQAVVLADGGFQGNFDMLRQHVSPAPQKVRQRGAATGVGDAARMAAAVGARLVRMNRFYGHVLHRDALTDDRLWPYPVMDLLCAAGVVLKRDGTRFVDESRGGVYVSNEIAALDEPDSAVVVFDDRAWQGPGRGFLLPPNPYLENAGGSIRQADDLPALLAGLDVDQARALATIETLNRAIEQGRLSELDPPRDGGSIAPAPIRVPPFRAIPLCAGITYTMGGIAIDAHGRALGDDDLAIAGLYAAGSCTGGIEGGRHADYTGGLSKAVVFGLRVAEHAAAHQHRGSQ